MDMKRCPYCAEEIRAEATRCRYCRSRLTSFETERWHRSHPEARIAGVCAALAHALALPITGLRVGFVIGFFLLPIHILVPLLYGALWLTIPKRPGGDSLLEQGLRWGLFIASRISGRPNGPSGPSSLMPS